MKVEEGVLAGLRVMAFLEPGRSFVAFNWAIAQQGGALRDPLLSAFGLVYEVPVWAVVGSCQDRPDAAIGRKIRLEHGYDLTIDNSRY